MQFFAGLCCFAAVSGAAFAVPAAGNTNPFTSTRSRRQDDGGSGPGLTVDLGYEIYEGVRNSSNGLNQFRGIRYAAAPIGKLRWQAPQTPAMNRSQTIKARKLPARCPQSAKSPLAPDYDFTQSALGDEDCLFLNVFAPPNAQNLPVFVWIHGGGYGTGQGDADPTEFINNNHNGLIAVIIQYRLGAFGFASSDEIKRFGVVNAGLLDVNFALQWVQSYIDLFGGNSSAVTIGGLSAGGGAVMLQAMAYGGTQGDSLFQNGIASSPYLPMQYGYADFVPSQSYYRFAAAVGCLDSINATAFGCLLTKDTATLQNASAVISATGRYGTWGFLPVTDGTFVQQLPTQQLLKKQVNGIRMLVGNNANEGPLFTPQNVVTEDDFVDFLKTTFPLFNNEDISKVLMYYPSTNASTDENVMGYSTLGDEGSTALNVSEFGTGQQQRANNLYAETTFVCPAYWMVEAFTDKGRASYKYQYSVPAAEHGSDSTAIFPPGTPNQAASFRRAFQGIWGNFVMHNDPAVTAAIATGNNSMPDVNTTKAGTTFPQWSIATPYQVNLNQSGGQPFESAFSPDLNLTEYKEPGLMNSFEIVNAYTWEGGRGMRCDFWRSVAAIVPQ
ncbi:MAG: hypothetical protein M1837_004609 [Sclerophora amabilis]|nr:MAG: hypothetical protein M1837_004609 [Sclerophora amabilis]